MADSTNENTDKFQPFTDSEKKSKSDSNLSNPSGNVEQPALMPELEPKASHTIFNNIKSFRHTFSGNKLFAILSIVAGILVMGGAFLIYSYFNQNKSETFGPENEIANVQVDDGTEGKITDEAVSDSNFESPDAYEGTGISPVSPQEAVKEIIGDNKQVAGTQTEISNSSPSTNSIKKPTSQWKANNYKKGDISAGSYEVVSGDTLWEIAEAVYGNGAQWQQIAQANNITYLANGNPLISPGQILTIP